MKISVLQHDSTDCGAACLASIARFYKLKMPISTIRQMAGTNRVGTSAFGIIEAAKHIGFNGRGIRLAIDNLHEMPMPAIAHVKLKNGGGHFVVLYKIKRTKSVEFMDPALGRVVKMSYAEFQEMWTGVVLLFIPSEKFSAGVFKTSNFKRFLFLMKPHKEVFIQSIIGAIIYTFLGLSISIYAQKITDFVLIGQNRNLLNMLGIVMCIVLIFQFLFGLIKSFGVLKTGQNIDARLLIGYFKYLMELPLSFFNSMRSGEIISRVNDALKIRSLINNVLVNVTVDLFVVVGAFILMAIYHYQMALMASLIIPAFAFIYWISNSCNKKNEREWMEDAAELEVHLIESVKSIRTIKQFGIEDFVGVKAENRFVKVLKRFYISGKTSLYSENSLILLSRLLMVGVLWGGAGLVLRKVLTPGELISFFALVSFCSPSLVRILNLNKTMQKSLVAADRLFELMDLKVDVVLNQMDIEPAKMGDIKLVDVDFSYTLEKDLFKDFNLTIKKGDITSLVGESGSGKSTIAMLIQGMYLPQKGHVYIGDYNLKYIHADSLRAVVGVVSQDIELFSGNIIDNVALGEYQPNLSKVIDVLKRVGLLEHVESTIEGVYTPVGENGVTLSGGQRQRLAIARVLYRNPEIYIFDEATSFLDDRSEKKIKELMVELKNEGKTIIQVAHRVSSVAVADHIVVLNEGRIVEKGCKDELLLAKGRFYEMVKTQIGDYVFN